MISYDDMATGEELRDIWRDSGYDEALKVIRTIKEELSMDADIMTDKTYNNLVVNKLQLLQIPKDIDPPHKLSEWIDNYEEFVAYLQGEQYFFHMLRRLRNTGYWNEDRKRRYAQEWINSDESYEEWRDVLKLMPAFEQAHSYDMIFREDERNTVALKGLHRFQIYLSRVPEDHVWFAIEAKEYNRGWGDWKEFAEVMKDGRIVYKDGV